MSRVHTKTGFKLCNLYRITLILGLLAILGACADVSTPKMNINGIVSKGPIGGATVTVYALNSDGTAGEILGTAITEADGRFAVEIEDYTGNVLVVSSEGQYTDEATGETKENPGLRTALDNVKETNYVAVTALTEIAARRAEGAGGLITGNINDANTFVTDMIGNIDIVSTFPADVLEPSSASATENEKKYGLILAGMSQMVVDGAAPTISDVMTNISNDINDDQLDQTGSALVTAVDTFASSSDNFTGMTDSVINLVPIANAGTDQNITTWSLVTLDGSGSRDSDNGTLTYNWTFASTPSGSSATLSEAAAVSPTFTPDMDGIFVLNLVVSDGTDNSPAESVTVTAATANSIPVATAGPDQNLATGGRVTLDGSGSSDANDDSLTYSWTLTSAPNGSSASLSDSTAVNPTFIADLDGVYILSLVVNDGTDSSAADTLTITAATPGWGTAELLETDNAGSTYDPQIAIDANGNAIAVWNQSDGTQYNIWANRYTAGSGWGTAELIETLNGGYDAWDPQVAFDSNGNAIVVWAQRANAATSGRSIWANRYIAGSGWGTAELIETDSGGASDPQIASDGNGNAIAVWTQSDGTYARMWVNRYTAGSGWGTPELIGTGNDGHARFPELAVDNSGNAIAVWTQSDGTRENAYANRYTVGSGWGTAELIGFDNVYDVYYYPQVAFDGSGNAIAVWPQSDSTGMSIHANRYTVASGWGIAETIKAGNAQNPHIAVDSEGNAFASWWEYDDTGRHRAWFNSYVPGSGWGTAELMENSASGNAGPPYIAFDNSDNALAVWTISGDLYARRYTVSSGWGTEELIDTASGTVGWPRLAFDNSGNAIAVWQQFGGYYSIWANSFLPN